MGWGIAKAIFKYAFGDGSKYWRVGIFAALMGAMWWVRDQAFDLFEWVKTFYPHDQLAAAQDGWASNWFDWLQVANYWLPIQECLTLWSLYRAWWLAWMAFKLIKWLFRG